MYQLFLAGKSLADATLLKRLKGTSSLPVSKVVTLFWATLLKRLKGTAATDARNLRLGLGLGSLGSGGSYVQRFEAGPMYNVCTGSYVQHWNGSYVQCMYNVCMAGPMYNVGTQRCPSRKLERRSRGKESRSEFSLFTKSPLIASTVD